MGQGRLISEGRRLSWPGNLICPCRDSKRGRSHLMQSPLCSPNSGLH